MCVTGNPPLDHLSPILRENDAASLRCDLPDTAVVHLLRQCNPPEAFVRFIESYRRNAESLPHDLIVIFKGFGVGEDAWALEALAGIRFQRVDCLDAEFDLGPYLHFGRSLPYRYFCFLNSFSYILAENWLTKLSVALRELPHAGVVGATGNWQSMFSDMPFPNPHIRTNSFLISKELLCQLRSWPMREKLDCYRFESGANGLTNQILRRGLEPYVVDCHGRGWRKEQWNLSRTLRSCDQECLLVADSSTDAYQFGSPRRRRKLMRFAWTPPRVSAIRWLKDRLGICPRRTSLGASD